MIHSTEYSRSFWNAMRRGSQAEFGLLDRSARHTNTGTYMLPVEDARKYEDKLVKVGVFRRIATVAGLSTPRMPPSGPGRTLWM